MADGAGNFGFHAGKILDLADVVVGAEIKHYGMGIGGTFGGFPIGGFLL